MSWESDKARGLLETALERVEAGRHDMAQATLCRAFDVLERADPDHAESAALRDDVLDRLVEVSNATKTPTPLVERAVRALPSLTARPTLGRAILEQALDGGLHDLHAIELYVTWTERRGPLSESHRRRLNEILAYKLHIRLGSDLEEYEEYVPFLERLFRARPRLAYPRLFLARHHLMTGDFERAQALLQDIEGRLKKSPKVLNIRGRCAEKQGMIDEAQVLFHLSLERRADQADIHFRAGRLFLQRFLEAGEVDDDDGWRSPGSRPFADAETRLTRGAESHG